MSLLICTCCCVGKTQAQFYDRLFILYLLFIIGSICTYIYAFYVRTQYTSKVCSGDFLQTHEIEPESALLMQWDIEYDYYIIQFGRLLNWFVCIESVFFLCCICSSSIWLLV